MPSSSKRKGSKWEVQITEIAKEKGLPAVRAWGSDGRSMNQASSVDCLVAGLRVQAKIRKSLASFLQVPEGCDAVFFRQDRGPGMVLMNLSDFLNLLKQDED